MVFFHMNDDTIWKVMHTLFSCVWNFMIAFLSGLE